VKLNASGSALVYSTYLGGSGDEEARGIALDSAGNAYVTGYTGSTDFPTANPLQDVYGGGFSDAFVTKLNASGSALVYSTYLGGSGDEEARGIALDSAGNAYVTGFTRSADFRTTPLALKRALGSLINGFVAKISPEGCLDAPIAMTPSGATASRRPTFTWSAVQGAEGYTVVLAPINDPLAEQILGTSPMNSFTPTSDIPDGDYSWTVGASSRLCGSGPFSDLQFFTIPGTCPLSAPNLLSPPNASTVNSPVEFRWSSVAGASFYNLYVSDASTNEIVKYEMVRTTAFTATLAPGIYFWVVSGWNSTCDSGPESSPSVFAIP
jgi:hypothetical protein